MDVLVIFVAQVVYVSMMTLRWILLLKGQRYLAAALSVLEISLYVYALSLVVAQLGDLLRLLTYSVGYAVGSLVGTWLEERLAFGYLTVQVITRRATGLSQALREAGFGVTSWPASGKDGEREVLMVVARRRWGERLYELIDQVAPNSFVLAIETRGFRGGFLSRRLMPSPVSPPTPPGTSTAAAGPIPGEASNGQSPVHTPPRAGA